MIKVGDKVPDAEVQIIRDGAPAAVQMSELLGSGQVVLFAVPGAFTPVCSEHHLPSFLETASELTESGVDRILCLGVNDAFVMHGWGMSQSVGSTITMIGDPHAAFTKAIAMEVDATSAGLGVRSMRYALVAQDGIVTAFFPEDDGFDLVASTGQNVLRVVIDHERRQRQVDDLVNSDFFSSVQDQAAALRKASEDS